MSGTQHHLLLHRDNQIAYHEIARLVEFLRSLESARTDVSLIINRWRAARAPGVCAPCSATGDDHRITVLLRERATSQPAALAAFVRLLQLPALSYSRLSGARPSHGLQRRIRPAVRLLDLLDNGDLLGNDGGALRLRGDGDSDSLLLLLRLGGSLLRDDEENVWGQLEWLAFDGFPVSAAPRPRNGK